MLSLCALSNRPRSHLPGGILQPLPLQQTAPPAALRCSAARGSMQRAPLQLPACARQFVVHECFLEYPLRGFPPTVAMLTKQAQHIMSAGMQSPRLPTTTAACSSATGIDQRFKCKTLVASHAQTS